MRNRTVSLGVSALILLSAALLFISPPALGASVHSELANSIAYIAGFAGAHSISPGTIVSPLRVNVTGTTAYTVIASGTVCGFSPTPPGNLSFSDDSGSLYVVQVMASFINVSNGDYCIYGTSTALRAGAASKVTMQWTGSQAYLSSMGVAVYSGVIGIGTKATKAQIDTFSSQMNVTLIPIIGQNSWVFGWSWLGGGCDAGGNYPTLRMGNGTGRYMTPTRLDFNSDPMSNECFAFGDSHRVLPSAGNTWLSASSFTLPGPAGFGTILELLGAVNPPVWQNPSPSPSSPFFFDWVTPLVFVAFFILMVGSVVWSGFTYFRDF